LLLKARIIIRKEQTGISIEPLLDDRIRGDVLTHIVHWASQRSSAVSIRLEGHRGKNPLPAVDRRTGSIDEVLKIRRFGRKPYRIEFELR